MVVHANPVAEAPAPSADGHFLHKSFGDCMPTGPFARAARPPHATAADCAASLDRDGYVVLPKVFGAEEVAALRAWIDGLGGDDARYEVPQWCFNKHVGAAYHRDPAFLRLIDRPAVVAAARAVLGADCQVIGGSLWVTGPGRAMGLHADYIPMQLPEDVAADPRVRMPAFVATAHFYLDDLTPEFGPTLLIPGSHRAGRPPRDEVAWRGRAPELALVDAGDCLLFRSEIWHGAARNQGPRRRYLIQVHYANVYIASGVPPVTRPESWSAESLAAVTPLQRSLLGAPESVGRGSYIDHRALAFSTTPRSAS
ncbi:MAG TPA: phytanoyl-CoA dioxygenase family protein [Planctomycetota bacterium]|nr:phytanoyl-CoA dioxygenase family protein [Planctomycetota bacterium]